MLAGCSIASTTRRKSHYFIVRPRMMETATKAHNIMEICAQAQYIVEIAALT